MLRKMRKMTAPVWGVASDSARKGSAEMRAEAEKGKK